ncbi:MAG: phospholipid carrier-dependent glycosyltransferase [Actinomycetota bacterium]
MSEIEDRADEAPEPDDEPGAPAWSTADTYALAAVTVVGGILRLLRLGTPGSLMFDEVYYAKDACWYVKAAATVCGIADEQTRVHPPLGKWLLAIGVRLFDYDAFGWRIMAVVAGTITIALLYLLARKLLGSTLGATIASGLLAVDLLHFVQSRVAMLDIFVPLFGVAAVLFAVYDRDRLLPALAGGSPLEPRGANPLDRPWRLAAGAAAGAAVASKWSGGLVLLLVVVVTMAWELRARLPQGWGRALVRTIREESASLVAWFALVPLALYVATYAGRLQGQTSFCPVPEGSWPVQIARLQKCMFEYHTTLEARHSYESPAWSWVLLKRPVSYFFEKAPNGDYREVLATGNPVIWWASLLALAVVAAIWMRHRHPARPEGVILAGFAFTYVPWLAIGRDAVFIFYLLPTIPFMCLALGYVATRIGTSWEARAAVSLFAAATLGTTAFYYPLAANVSLPYERWDRRIWQFEDEQCEKPPGTPVKSTITETVGGTPTTRTTETLDNSSIPPKGWCWI